MKDSSARTQDQGTTQPAVYDEIAEAYRESKELPFRKYIEEYSLFLLLGDLSGKDVLDVACGEGTYSRKISAHGARRILGVDVSQRMVALARAREHLVPLGIRYLIADAADLGKIGAFDVALASYLLNYARSEQELLRFCRGVHDNLKTGGRVVGLNDNPMNASQPFRDYRKYGFTRAAAHPIAEGDPIHYTFFNPGGEVFAFDNYFWKPETYVRVFREAGFRAFRWRPPMLSEAGRVTEATEFWDFFLEDAPVIGFEAVK